VVRPVLCTPRAAAIAGIVFSALLICVLWLLRAAAPNDVSAIRALPDDVAGRLSLALNLVPFAGVAFIWFLGVLRDRLGAKEDQFFATALLGAGLIFLVMMFVAASSVSGIVQAHFAGPAALPEGGDLALAKALSHELMQVYAFGMAALFMAVISTLALYIGFVPRRIAALGYACAALILLAGSRLSWVLFVLPGWVLLVSISILVQVSDRHGGKRA
jgi:hypothetical protein